jgi:phenylalanyl-tRNA synthetase alpha chain
MKEKLEALKDQALSTITSLSSIKELEDARIRILGKKGELTELLKEVGTLRPSERPVICALANTVKQEINDLISSRKENLEQEAWTQELQSDQVDVTLPGKGFRFGTLHPLNQVLSDVIILFSKLGYSVQEGPDIESEYFNFEALNIPANHPARDMHDTFYFSNKTLLRTHTSPVQIRTMKNHKPPLKIIVPGKVYRCDADVTHSPVFHQVEGLYVNEKVTFAELKGTLQHFLKELFGKSMKVRFRPSYFPFTEPSTEVDVQCFKCSGNGCSVCKNSGWLEILGAGMVHRNVFRSVGYDPAKVSGFAFGMGIERIAMLKYEITDIRLFYENDSRFLNQF